MTLNATTDSYTKYTGIEGQGSFLTRGNSQPLKLPLTNPKPLPSLQKALLGTSRVMHENIQTYFPSCRMGL